MSSSSEDLLPLINRVQHLASSQPTILASDDDEDVPLWLRNYTSPKQQQQKRPKKATALLSDSDDEPPPPTKAPTNHNAPAAAAPQPSPLAPAPAPPLRGTPATAALLGGSTAKGTQAANELVVHLPDRLPRTKLLVELEPDDHGATDLAGDAGAVGRVLVAGQPGQEDIRLDLKGVVYEATVVALPGTVCVVNASGGGGDAKVEALFSDMLQLRPDMTNALVRQQEGLYNALMMEDDDNYVAAAAEDGGEAPAKPKSRKKAEGVKPAPKRKPATKRPAGGRASKPAAKRAKKK